MRNRQGSRHVCSLWDSYYRRTFQTIKNKFIGPMPYDLWKSYPKLSAEQLKRLHLQKDFRSEASDNLYILIGDLRAGRTVVEWIHSRERNRAKT